MKTLRKLSLPLAGLMALSLLGGCSAAPATNPTAPAASTVGDTVAFTDDAGRTVTVPKPDKMNKVFYPSPLAQAAVYAIAPEKMVGTVSEIKPADKKYWPKLGDVPALGTFQAGQAPNYEAIIKAGTQVYISMGPTKINEASKTDADALEKQLGMPVVVLSGLYTDAPSTYRKLGVLFGQKERAEKLAAYCERVIKDTQAKVATIPEDKRVKIYYAENANGLATEPETSSHAAVIKYAGGANVAKVEMKPGSGMSPVSLEQVIAWNPDVIVTTSGPSGAAKEITTNKDWASINAVKNKRVLVAPTAPFSWIDRPPSVQQFLGTQWLANKLYPETFPMDMKAVTKEFYQLFFQADLSDAELTDLLETKA